MSDFMGNSFSVSGQFPFEFFRPPINDEVVDDLRKLIQLDESVIESAKRSLAEQAPFLTSEQLKSALDDGVEDQSKASLVYRIIRWVGRFRRQDGRIDRAFQLLRDIQASADDEDSAKPVFSEADLDAVRKRIQGIMACAPGLERQAKADSLAEATGHRLKSIRLICDLRPIFDSKRERIEGVLPLTTLTAICEGVTGFPVGFEAVLSEKDVENLYEMALMAKQEGRCPEFVAGTSLDLGGGLTKYRWRNQQGRVDEFIAQSSYNEPQSLADDQQSQSDVQRHTSSLQPAVASASTRARDVAQPTKERLEGLQGWMAEDNDPAAEFVISELASNELAPDWRNVLIYAAEAVRFRDPAVRTRAVDVLLKNATSLRHSNEQGISEVVWGAVHRIGSIIPVGRANELAVFLGPSDPVDTRLATLQAIVRIFEVAPPDDPSTFADLAERSVVLAMKLWDRDVFAAGENSAIAIEATVATASLADKRVLDLVDLAAKVGRSWVLGKLQRRFDELLSFWQKVADSGSSRSLVHDASRRVNNLIATRL